MVNDGHHQRVSSCQTFTYISSSHFVCICLQADSLKVPSSFSSSSGLCSPQSVAFNRNLGSVCRLDLSGVSDCDGLRSRVKEMFVGKGPLVRFTYMVNDGMDL